MSLWPTEFFVIGSPLTGASEVIPARLQREVAVQAQVVRTAPVMARTRRTHAVPSTLARTRTLLAVTVPGTAPVAQLAPITSALMRQQRMRSQLLRETLVGVSLTRRAVLGAEIVRTTTIGANTMSCEAPIYVCIAQAEARTFVLEDRNPSAGYDSADEITFDVWDKPPKSGTATNLITRSLSGTTITVLDSISASFDLNSTDSAALPIGNHYFEAWVTEDVAGEEKRLVAYGRFEVIDTRKHD